MKQPLPTGRTAAWTAGVVAVVLFATVFAATRSSDPEAVLPQRPAPTGTLAALWPTGETLAYSVEEAVIDENGPRVNITGYGSFTRDCSAETSFYAPNTNDTGDQRQIEYRDLDRAYARYANDAQWHAAGLGAEWTAPPYPFSVVYALTPFGSTAGGMCRILDSFDRAATSVDDDGFVTVDADRNNTDVIARDLAELTALLGADHPEIAGYNATVAEATQSRFGVVFRLVAYKATLVDNVLTIEAISANKAYKMTLTVTAATAPLTVTAPTGPVRELTAADVTKKD